MKLFFSFLQIVIAVDYVLWANSVEHSVPCNLHFPCKGLPQNTNRN